MGYTMWLELTPRPWRYDPTPHWNFLSGIEALRAAHDRGAERPCKPLSPPPPSTLEPLPEARRGQNSPQNGHPEWVSGYVRFSG